MSLIGTDFTESTSTEKTLLSQLWVWLSPDKRLLYILIALMILSVGVAVLGPIFLQQSIDLLENTDNPSLIRSDALNLALIYSLSVIAIFFLQVVQNIIIAKVNSQFIHRIRIDAFRKIILNKISFFDHSEAGRIVSRITNDTNELMDSGKRFANAFSQLIIFVGVLSVMLYYNVILTIAALIVTPILFIGVISMRKFQRSISKRWRTNLATVNTQFGEVIGSIMVTKSFGREEENLARFHKINESTYQAAKVRGMVIFANGPLSDFLRTLGLITLIFVSARQLDNGESLAIVYMFILLQTFLYDPITTIARSYSQFQSSLAAMDRILYIMADQDTLEPQGGDLVVNDLKGKIEFENVNFSYIEGEKVLQDMKFVIKEGETIALVGHTGAGKTTIAALLMQFYEINSGRILIDDRPITEYRVNQLRLNIGYVSQEVLLFSGTIRENMQLAKINATDEDIWQAIGIVQATEFIDALPMGLDTLILEGGKNLSHGQQQMLSLARAILVDPKILILDEFTSSLDLYTEAKIQNAIKVLLKERTSIVIAHRLTTILNSDQILVLEKGRLIEQGTHRELMANPRAYAEIYDQYFSFQIAGLNPIIHK